MLHHYRIGQAYSNAYAEWARQGQPMYPTPGQHEAIKARDGLDLLAPPQKLISAAGKIELNFILPLHGVSLLMIGPGSEI